MRIALLACLAGLVALMPAPAAPAPAGSALYTVRPDPRLCPSPLCGGYWVALANRKQTQCADGVLRGRCYAARAVDEERHPLESGVPPNALVRADLEPWSFEGFGELGTLVVAAAWEPAGRAKPSGSFYRLRDTGMRCIRAPCFWLRASQLNATRRTTGSDLDLTATDATPEELARAEVALRTANGLFASGRLVATRSGGRTFHATVIYLRAARPRA